MIQTAPRPRPSSRPSPRLVPAVERAIRILRLLASDGGPRRLTDLSRALAVSKSTLFELLATLEQLGFVERDGETRAFRLGYGVLELGNAVLRRLDLRQVARPYLTRLRDAIGETAVLHMRADQGALIVDRVESDHQLKVVAPVGHRLPPFAGSVAKVFAAELADKELTALLRVRVLRAFTPRSMTSAQRYRKEILRVRRRGYAVDDEEYLPGVCAVSAPVLDSRGRTVAAVTIVGSSVRLSEARMRQAATAVLDAAASISRRLGAPAYTRAAARQRMPVGG
ncbi:MAG: IclR family transcriptional regulator [bacterium]